MTENAPTGPSILLVEDDPCAALLLRTMLKKDGYRVLHCGDGEAALDALATSTFDAVVLDLMMPKVDGMQVLKQMRSIPETSQTPVFLLTAARLKLIEEQAALYRVHMYLEKTETGRLRSGLRDVLLAGPAVRESKLRMADSAVVTGGTAPKPEPPKGLARLFGRKG